MLGAAHATANPLTARHGVIHGHAVALMLPHVMRFNAADAAVNAIYARYSAILNESRITSLPLIDWVTDIVTRASIPGINGAAKDFAALATDAAKQWTGQFNPRPLQQDDYIALYRRALESNAAA
jgi:alcohol dehydrogenase